MNMILRELNMNDEAAFLRGFQDWQGQDPEWYSFAWKPGMSHMEHLRILESEKDKNNLPPHRVPGTMLYAFVDGEIVGRLNVRHELNEKMLERGGHVGYAVSPRHRKKGYASRIFELGLDFCRQLGLEKILITCADQNVPSWKIIEKFGSTLENRILDADEKEFVRRYWLDLDLKQFQHHKVSHKAVAYITRSQGSRIELLVFDHDPEFSDAGTQVPSGTVEWGEDPKMAMVREIFEESGLKDLKMQGLIDQYQFYADHAKKYLTRLVYHLEASANLPDRWTHQVQGSGADKDMNFHYFWIELQSAKGRLSVRFDDSVDVLIQKLKKREG